MPIPKPKPAESRESFLQRCMSDDTMVYEYEPAQRYAVCNIKWNERPKDEPTGQDRAEG